MRPVSKFAAGILAVVVAASSTQAALLVSDSFSYPDGTALVGQTPPTGGTWAAHSGTTGPVTVNGGSIAIVQASSATQDVNVPFAGGYTLGAGLKAYASFDLTVADPGSVVSSQYFAMFLQGTSNFDGRIWITAPTSSGYRLAISNDNSITDNDGEVFTTDLAFGQTYKVVSVYDYDAKAAKLWIDPADESSASIAPTDPGFSDASAAYAFRQAGGNSTQTIDNLKVGTTFADVVSVPEPTSAGLLGIGALGLIRRRRVSR